MDTMLSIFEYEFACLFLQLRENRNPCFLSTLLAFIKHFKLVHISQEDVRNWNIQTKAEAQLLSHMNGENVEWRKRVWLCVFIIIRKSPPNGLTFWVFFSLFTLLLLFIFFFVFHLFIFTSFFHQIK